MIKLRYSKKLFRRSSSKSSTASSGSSDGGDGGGGGRRGEIGWEVTMNHRYFKMDAVPVSDTARYGDTPRYGPIRPDTRIGKYRKIMI